MRYENNYDLMDQKMFPNDSIYIFKENPKKSSKGILRVAKSDEEVIDAVTAEMKGTLGTKIES